MVKIANATIKVVLRRDMSLNRRLYAWLLGTDASGNPLQVCSLFGRERICFDKRMKDKAMQVEMYTGGKYIL